MKNHKTISFIKSLIRIIGLLILISDLVLGVLVLVGAELIGIIEEEYENK